MKKKEPTPFGGPYENWFCATIDGYAVSIRESAGEVEIFIEDMMEEGYEISDIYIFPMSARNEPKAVTKPSFEFRP